MTTLSIQRNVSLAPYTTLGIGGPAEYFVNVSSTKELTEAVKWARENKKSITVLGGGSNVLIDDKGIRGLVIHLTLNEVLFKEETGRVLVTAGAGKELDELIETCVAKGFWGLENLSAIPGSVGATPIQNVGAYGTETSDVLASVVAYDLINGAEVEFTNEACAFGYRTSRFKSKGESGRYIILWVTFTLTKERRPKLSYNDLERYFKYKNEPSLREIREAVQSIRSRKFPDWHELGTAGSFFKNPLLTTSEYERLLIRYPDIPGFQLPDRKIKIPLGYVLDHVLHLKGTRKGNVGLFADQALVLVNHGGATTEEVVNFADEIVSKVRDATGIGVEWEVTRLH